MSQSEHRPSNLSESFDNIPAIDDDEQSEYHEKNVPIGKL